MTKTPTNAQRMLALEKALAAVTKQLEESRERQQQQAIQSADLQNEVQRLNEQLAQHPVEHPAVPPVEQQPRRSDQVLLYPDSSIMVNKIRRLGALGPGKSGTKFVRSLITNVFTAPELYLHNLHGGASKIAKTIRKRPLNSTKLAELRTAAKFHFPNSKDSELNRAIEQKVRSINVHLEDLRVKFEQHQAANTLPDESDQMGGSASDPARSSNANSPEEGAFPAQNQFGSSVLTLTDRVGFEGYMEFFNNPNLLVQIRNEMQTENERREQQTVPSAELTEPVINDVPATNDEASVDRQSPHRD